MPTPLVHLSLYCSISTAQGIHHAPLLRFRAVDSSLRQEDACGCTSLVHSSSRFGSGNGGLGWRRGVWCRRGYSKEAVLDAPRFTTCVRILASATRIWGGSVGYIAVEYPEVVRTTNYRGVLVHYLVYTVVTIAQCWKLPCFCSCVVWHGVRECPVPSDNCIWIWVSLYARISCRLYSE